MRLSRGESRMLHTARFALAYCLLPLLAALTSAACRAEMVQLADAKPVLSARLTPADDWPQGRSILLLHGTLSHRDTEIIESLEYLFADAGYSTLAINLSLGSDNRDGPFDCANEHRHLEGDASAELARWLDWLEAQGAGSVTLMGHSRGANQIARYALHSGDTRINDLLLVAPPRWSAATARAGYRNRHGEDLDQRVAEARKLRDAGRSAQLMPEPVGLLYCEQVRVTPASFLSYYEVDRLRDTPTLLAALSLPVLVVAGSEDTVAADLPTALAGARDNISVVEIDGADHFFRDLYADELVDAALDFLESH